MGWNVGCGDGSYEDEDEGEEVLEEEEDDFCPVSVPQRDMTRFSAGIQFMGGLVLECCCVLQLHDKTKICSD